MKTKQTRIMIIIIKKKKSKANIKTKTFKKKNPNALKIHVTPLIMEDGLIIKSRTTTTKKSVR